MSITVTNKTPGLVYKTGTQDTTSTLTSGSLTPAASSLWVVFAEWTVEWDVSHGPTTAPTLALSGTNGLNVTWVEQDTALFTPPGGSNFWERLSVFTGTPSSTTAGTLTLTATDNSTGTRWNISALEVFELTATGILGVGTTGKSTFATGITSQSVTLNSAPASTSLILGMHYTDNDTTATVVQPTDWTEVNDYGDSWGSEWESAYINTGGSQTFSWTGLTSSWKHGSIAIEITETAVLNVIDRGVVGGAADNTWPNTYTTSSFSPTGGAILVVFAYAAAQHNGVFPSFSVSDTFSGTGSWTPGPSASIGHTYNYNDLLEIYTAVLGSTPGSGTVSVQYTGPSTNDDSWKWMRVLEITGQHSSPIGVNGSSTTVSSNQVSMTLSGTPGANSVIVTAAMSWDKNSDALTEPGGYSLVGETLDTSWQIELSVAYKNRSGSSPVVWTCTQPSGSAVALEIKPAGGGGGGGGPSTVEGTANISSAATVSSPASILLNSSSSIVSVATVSALGIIKISSSSSISSLATLSAVVLRITFTSSTINSITTVSGQLSPVGIGTIVSVTTVNTTAYLTRFAVATISVIAATSSDSLLIRYSSGTISATTTVSGTLTSTSISASATLTSLAALTVRLLSGVLIGIRQKSAAPAWPLKVSGRSFVDQSGKPFVMKGDAGWSMFVQLTTSDMDTYIANRKAKGFNSILINLLEHKFSDQAPNNKNGDGPFTTQLSAGVWDFSTPNEAYFAYVDTAVQKIKDAGMCALICPAYLGYNAGDEGWYSYGIDASGDTKMNTYGQYVGNRYKGYGNIVWMQGVDYVGGNFMARIHACATGLQTADPNAIQTFHGVRSTGGAATGVQSAGGGSWNLATDTWIVFDELYTDNDVVSSTLTRYAGSPTMPIINGEAWYEGEHSMGALGIRREAYAAYFSGCVGHVYGQIEVWQFITGWTTSVDSAGATTLKYLWSLIDTLPVTNMVPDNGTFITSGVGSGATKASALSNSRVAAVYFPDNRSMTINLGLMAGSCMVSWLDPANGRITRLGTYLPQSTVFTTSTNNSAGDSDWVLLITA